MPSVAVLSVVARNKIVPIFFLFRKNDWMLIQEKRGNRQFYYAYIYFQTKRDTFLFFIFFKLERVFLFKKLSF